MWYVQGWGVRIYDLFSPYVRKMVRHHLACIFCFLSIQPVSADSDFRDWVENFWEHARVAGISREIYDYAFSDLTPDPEVVRLALHQPEFRLSLADYLDRMLSEKRVRNGVRMAAQYRELLDEVEALYGVDRYTLLAIWGMETSYGEYLGEKYVVQSLATLGYHGIRESFCRKQLISALKIIQDGDMVRDQLLGSWAGALGHTQFIPSTFEDFAVDTDSDGRRDLRGTIPDALGSAANYLRSANSGWKLQWQWGYPVSVPKGFDYRFSDETFRSFDKWKALGVRRLGGVELSDTLGDSMLIFPVGARGSGFLVGTNFGVILRYNNSQHYALAVGLLSDLLRGVSYPLLSLSPEESPLSSKELKEIQMHLSQLGEEIGSIDGVIGRSSRAAIRSYQWKSGLLVDGYPDRHLLDHLRQVRE